MHKKILIVRLIVDLEVSKPQRNSRPPPSDINAARGRRSRSPEFSRAQSPRGRGGGSSFRGGRDYDRNFRGRDREYDYARRSPPPRHRARDDWRPHHRSRSRSPPARYRPRSRSPPEAESLPRRDPKDVPEVQAIVTDELDRLVRHFSCWITQC
jgi:nuclear polyadenylated RNA-binding protein 3